MSVDQGKTTDVREYVTARVRRAFKASELSVEQLSIRAAVHPKTVWRVLNGETCSLDTVSTIAAVLRIDWSHEGKTCESP